ncbi:MAG: penicillin acylase family protein [Anaerolineae bacterium]|nr:penicillin acylase family protein [Anaerolineae bacterium]
MTLFIAHIPVLLISLSPPLPLTLSLPLLVLLIVLGLPLLLVAAMLIFLRRPLPKTKGTLRVSGLKTPVEIIRDRWGVPHITASSVEDLFFAQGYVHAQDRLWQMELQRRYPSGRLAEVFGEVALESDRFMRTIGLRRAAEAGVAHLNEEERRVLEAYARGVNAFIEQSRRRLPVEFALLRFHPEPWTPADTLACMRLIAWQLSANWEAELLRARLAAKLGPERAASLEPPEPPDTPAIVRSPEARSAPSAVAAAQARRPEALREAYRQCPVHFSAALHAPGVTPAPLSSLGSSNNWVVDGRRSANGAPLLANDVHLSLAIPSVWYECHLQGAGFHVAGVSFPGIPGVVIGHNEHVAWGLTTAWQDVQDLYIERFNPGNPRQYEFRGQWEEIQVVREEIRVKGRSEPVVEEVLITRHGPIISKLVGEEQPLALRWTGLEPQHMVNCALNYNRARHWEEFTAALREWSCPPHNFVYADVEGHIGYVQAGWVPQRARGFGLLPVPGWTGEYEWDGYLPFEELPQAFDPPEGWLASANHKTVDDSYPHFLSADWEHSLRAQRIVELLHSRKRHTIADFLAMQLDDLSPVARRLLPVLSALEPEGELARRAVACIREWDCRMSADSVAATIYETWMYCFLHRVLDEPLGELADAVVGAGILPLSQISGFGKQTALLLLNLLTEDPPSPWLVAAAPQAADPRQHLLREALDEALRLLRQELGEEMGDWRWGRLHWLAYNHPLGSVRPLSRLFNRGPFPMAGDQDTLLRAVVVPRFPFGPVTTCDSLRMVCDAGDWRRSVIVTTSGQSGHPASRHYDDQIPLYLAGTCRPMLWDRADIEKEAEARLMLLP